MKRGAAKRASRRLVRGLTLIEVMVSITISLVILGALVYIYVGSRGAYRSNEALARTQETGRFALDWLTRDLKMTGYAGCRSREVTDVTVIARPPVAFAGIGDAVRGYVNDTSGWSAPPGVPYVRGDILVTRRAASAEVEIKAATNKDERKVTLAHSCVRFRKDDLAVIAACDRVVVFRVTNDPTYPSTNCATTELVLEHQVGTGTLGNGSASDSTSGKIEPVFQADTRATVQRFDQVAYFIGSNPGGRPALYRHSTLTGAAEEVVDNVEDLEILYAEDTSIPSDGAPDEYRAASAVANWANISAVRVSMVVIGGETGATTGGPQTYQFRGADRTAPDTRLRRVFSTTVALRNRLG